MMIKCRCLPLRAPLRRRVCRESKPNEIFFFLLCFSPESLQEEHLFEDNMIYDVGVIGLGAHGSAVAAHAAAR